MEPIIREVGQGQLAECAEVIRRSFQTVADEFGFTEETNPTNGAFIRAGKLLEEHRKGIRLFSLYAEGRQAGFVAIEKKDASLYYLEKLAVLPQCRHRGYGGLLLDYVRDYVRAAGGGQISIAIIDENARLKDWYRAYGFVQTSLRRFDHLTFTVCFMAMTV